jgi:hypothetical protein
MRHVMFSVIIATCTLALTTAVPGPCLSCRGGTPAWLPLRVAGDDEPGATLTIVRGRIGGAI